MTWAVAALFAMTMFGSERPVLATEVELLPLAHGDRVTIVGSYQSLMGSDLTLEGCSLPLALEKGVRYPVLRSLDLRSIRLSIRCSVVRDSTGPPVLQVIGATHGPTRSQTLDSVQGDFASISHARQLVIIRWVLGNATDPEQTREDTLAVAEDLLSAALDSALASDARSVKASEVLAIFSEHRAMLESRPIWGSDLPAFADRFANGIALQDVVRSLGFVRDDGHWTLEEKFLAEIRMVRRGEAVMSVERSELEDQIDSWLNSGRRKVLLRGLTNVQYDGYVRKRQLHEGMNREEALRSWGYPFEVTWVNRGETRFEVWRYRSRRAYLVGDLVFDWAEE